MRKGRLTQTEEVWWQSPVFQAVLQKGRVESFFFILLWLKGCFLLFEREDSKGKSRKCGGQLEFVTSLCCSLLFIQILSVTTKPTGLLRSKLTDKLWNSVIVFCLDIGECKTDCCVWDVLCKAVLLLWAKKIILTTEVSPDSLLASDPHLSKRGRDRQHSFSPEKSFCILVSNDVHTHCAFIES